MASLLSLSLPKPNLIKASALSATAPESLNDRFGRKGIKFSDQNDTPSVELTVRNGSSVRLHIPDAHVTSYRPKVYWKDDGCDEVLYTLPSSSSSRARGGVGLILNEAADPKTSLLSACEWTVKDVDSDAIDALQVELSSSSGTLELTYVVTLYPVSMATAIIVKNKGRKAVSLNSAILSYFKFKRRGKAAIQGLRGCSYCTHPPLSSHFELLSPGEAMKADSSPPSWLSFGYEPEIKPGVWTEQDVPVTLLENKMSRVYAAPPEERVNTIYNTPPTKYELLDQARELFFRVIRMGFEDIYVSSPGSLSEKYGADYFACTGPASILVPVVVEPGEEWRGASVIEHDNL